MKFSIATDKRPPRRVFPRAARRDLHTTFSITAFNFFVCQSWGEIYRARARDRFRRCDSILSDMSFRPFSHIEAYDALRRVVDFYSRFLGAIKKHDASGHCSSLIDFRRQSRRDCVIKFATIDEK